jgi:ribosomal protein L37AE/L43A
MALIAIGAIAFSGWMGFWYGSKNNVFTDEESVHKCDYCGKKLKAKELNICWLCFECNVKRAERLRVAREAEHPSVNEVWF